MSRFYKVLFALLMMSLIIGQLPARWVIARGIEALTGTARPLTSALAQQEDETPGIHVSPALRATALSAPTRIFVPLVFSTNRRLVIAAAGDIACAPATTTTSGCKQKETSDLLLRINPAAVLALGDTQYEKGEYANFLQSFDPSWGRLKNRIYPVVGNHEHLTPDATGYYDYFNGVGQHSGRAGERDKGYYAFTLGTWRIYAMNSNCDNVQGCGEGSAQEQWLAADLAANPAQCQLMFMHHPYVSSLNQDNYNAYPQQSALWQDFYDAHGDLVLAGHAHFYERFAQQTPAREAEPGRGIRLIIVGTGGKSTYAFGTTRPNSEKRIGNTFGVVKVQLNPDSYDWSFVAIDGSVLDSGTTTCH